MGPNIGLIGEHDHAEVSTDWFKGKKHGNHRSLFSKWRAVSLTNSGYQKLQFNNWAWDWTSLGIYQQRGTGRDIDNVIGVCGYAITYSNYHISKVIIWWFKQMWIVLGTQLLNKPILYKAELIRPQLTWRPKRPSTNQWRSINFLVNPMGQPQTAGHFELTLYLGHPGRQWLGFNPKALRTFTTHLWHQRSRPLILEHS